MRREMPVAVKFSEKFYARFGHELTDEFVSYLNQIDTGYRSELRELNELNFARFDAKLEQQIAELRSDLKQELTALDSHWDRRFAQLDSKNGQRLSEPRSEMAAGFAQLTADLIWWMFVFWSGFTVIVVGTMIALVKL